MTKQTILIVEDEAEIREGIRILLSGENYSILEAENGEQALNRMSDQIDLVILDVMMPGISGLRVCEEIRKTSTVPILFLTAKAQESDKLIGLTAGGDDYLVKPFDFEELLARIRAMTRKHAGNRSNLFTVGNLAVDTERRTVTKNGKEIPLLAKEFSLLEYMVRNKGAVLSREQMEDRIWNYEYSGSSNNIDVYISRLRKKLEGGSGEKLIHTVRGAGWVFRDPEKGDGA